MKRKIGKTRLLSLALAGFLIGATPFTTMGSVTAYAVESQSIAEIAQILPGRLTVTSPYYRDISKPSNVTGNVGSSDTIFQVHAGDLNASNASANTQAQAVRNVSQEANTPVYDSDELKSLIAERNAREQAWTQSLLTNAHNENDALRRAAFRGELADLSAVSALENNGLDNVLPVGAILTSDAFDGCRVTYNGKTSYTLAPGINEIEVTVTMLDSDTPKSILNVDLFTPQNSFRADSNLLSSTGGLGVNIRKGMVWKTKMFIIGAPDYAQEVATAKATGQPLVHNRVLKPQQNVRFDANGRAITPDAVYEDFVRAIQAAEEADREQRAREAQSRRGQNETIEAEQNPQSTESEQSWSEENNGSSGGNEQAEEKIRPQSDQNRSPSPTGQNSDNEDLSRTIMIYLNGSDLESNNFNATKNLQQIMSAMKGYDGDNIRVIVMTGGTKTWHVTDTKDKSGKDWTNNMGISDADLVTSGDESKKAKLTTDNQIWEIKNGKMILLKDDFAHGHGMMEVDTLTDFIEYAAALYNSDLLDIIFWDHGAGPEGFGNDELNAKKSGMSLQDIRDALDNAFFEKAIYFDFIGFDACMMGNAEVAFTLEPCADYLIGSEELEPGDGWDYVWLKTLCDNPNLSTVDLGKEIVDTFIAQYDQNDKKTDATLSVVDLTRTYTLRTAVTELADELLKSVKDLDNSYNSYFRIQDVRKNAMSFSTTSGYFSKDLIDLGVFCSLLCADNNGISESIKTKCRAVLAQLADPTATSTSIMENGIVRYTRQSSNVSEKQGNTTYYPSGLSIYFPYYGVYSIPDPKHPGDVFENYRIVDLLKVYNTTKIGDSRLIPDSYVTATAAFALRQISGIYIRDEWRNSTVTYDRIYSMLKGITPDNPNDTYFKDKQVKTVLDASGMTEAEVKKLIEKQIAERIIATNITVEPVYDTQDPEKVTCYTVKTSGTNRDVLKKMNVKISFEGKKTDKNGDVITKADDQGVQKEVTESINLGKSPFFEGNVTASDNAVTYTANFYDNYWYTIGYSLTDTDYTNGINNEKFQISSFYFTEKNDDYYVGVIPLCIWFNDNDMKDYTGSNRLSDAYKNNKIDIYMLQVRFDYDSQNERYSDQGTILGAQNYSLSGANRGLESLYKNCGYEIMGNAESVFDDSGNLNESVRSVGLVLTDTSGLLDIKMQPVSGIDTVYSLMDAYGGEYDLTYGNLADDTRAAGDKTADNADDLNKYAAGLTPADGAINMSENITKATEVQTQLVKNPGQGNGKPGTTTTKSIGSADRDASEEEEEDRTSPGNGGPGTEVADRNDGQTGALTDDTVSTETDASAEKTLTSDANTQAVVPVTTEADASAGETATEADAEVMQATSADDAALTKNAGENAAPASTGSEDTDPAAENAETETPAIAQTTPAVNEPDPVAPNEPAYTETPVSDQDPADSASQEDNGTDSDEDPENGSPETGSDVEIIEADAQPEKPSDPVPEAPAEDAA